MDYKTYFHFKIYYKQTSQDGGKKYRNSICVSTEITKKNTEKETYNLGNIKTNCKYTHATFTKYIFKLIFTAQTHPPPPQKEVCLTHALCYLHALILIMLISSLCAYVCLHLG